MIVGSDTTKVEAVTITSRVASSYRTRNGVAFEISKTPATVSYRYEVADSFNFGATAFAGRIDCTGEAGVYEDVTEPGGGEGPPGESNPPSGRPADSLAAPVASGLRFGAVPAADSAGNGWVSTHGSRTRRARTVAAKVAKV